jgi:alkaline phosphatase D
MQRRRFLQALGGLSGAALLPGCGSSGELDGAAGTVRFDHGVASGDPLSDRVILWTRVTPAQDAPVRVRYVVARDPALSDVIASAEVVTDLSRDYTVKVDPQGLAPGTHYWYRFEAGGAQSPVGRTKTLPVGSVERLRFAYTSCSNYSAGYFGVYGRIAERLDLDAVFHLGDYLYESGSSGAEGLNRGHSNGREMVTLDDYRDRHAQYRTDPDLQAMTRQHPLIVVWDDHESTNDSWRDGADNHTEGEEGVWELRKAASIMAYFEWLPIRVADPVDPQRIWRQFVFGDLVDLIMLDTRLYGRDEPLGILPAGPELTDPTRQMLGLRQENWLVEKLTTSTTRWKLLGQQVMFGQLRLATLPDLSLLGVTLAEELLALNGDQWDGYPAARDRVFDAIERGAVDNVVVLTGDIHSSWGNELYRDPGDLVALLDNVVGDPLELGLIKAQGVEFVSPSVTSSGLPEAATPVLRLAFRAVDPQIKYFDGSRHGYVLLDITPERTQGEWWYVDSILEPDSPERFGAALLTRSGENRLRNASEPTEPATAAAPAP